ncbi:divergent polysaccharide deacetylase family protein [Pseudodesulfovibrio sediminis]|uniref:Divergent polysaccharide deacetylase family protein n=1 Tax=Pseudodesulfovibrio sediminis TaxID=2810563 RepID=A0ABN6EMD6_9BACT|nr:divergent polysaccharide deacetylase family protein [Pseudodesulfovibrio sediminis]BCS87211.1 hypothetical protein PSDVSF_04530 [Pseudodesulfovibrio sediminis]
MDDHSPEETTQEQTGFDKLVTKLYRPGPLIAFFSVVFLALVSLGIFILTKETPPPPVLPPPAAQEAPVETKEYEEPTSEMEDWVKQADLAIIQSMQDLGLKMSNLDLVDVELRQLDGRGYHYQILQMPKVDDRQHFLITLRKRLYERLPDAVLLDNGDNEAMVEINGLPTHRLLLEAKPRVIAIPEVKGPKLAIVIDDVGENYSVLKGLIRLDLNLTFAVWPNASSTRASVELISQNRHDLIVHFPMEPIGYPAVNPGDDALFVTMSAADIRKQVQANLQKIPEAIGVNNHMGSQFTGNAQGMRVALEEFKRHGLYFLDSLTSSKSVGRKVAKSVAIPFYERDTFLDNVKDVDAIVHQLKKTERVALTKGTAIAIGHPYKETLAALKKWSKSRNRTIQIIALSRLSPE